MILVHEHESEVIFLILWNDPFHFSEFLLKHGFHGFVAGNREEIELKFNSNYSLKKSQQIV